MKNNNIPLEGLYCIITEQFCGGRTAVETASELIKAGVKIIQYREKDKSRRGKYLDCVKIRELTKTAGVCFIVNDDVDIALAVKADGVHIGQDDMPLEAVRTLVEGKMMIGLSTTCPKEALDGVAKGADYIGVGPIYPTQTKASVAVGLEYLDFVAKNIKIPFVAIGGIKLHNLDEVLRHGARCVSLITEIVSFPDISERVNKVRKILSTIW